MFPKNLVVTDEVYEGIKPHIESLVRDEVNRDLFISILEDYVEYPVISKIIQRYLDGQD